MVEVLTDCSAGVDYGGAAIVAIVFLSVFVVLIVGDGVLSGFAIWKAIQQGKQIPDSERVRRARNVLVRLCGTTQCPGLESVYLKADGQTRGF